MARTLRFLHAAALCGALIWHMPALADTSIGVADAGRVALDFKDVPRWSEVMARAEAERAGLQGCEADSGACRYAAWRDEVEALRSRAAFEQIAAVQIAVNRIPYVSDLQNWRMADRWATPAEMFAKGGDCEDYALTKYFALRELGFAESAMQLAVVWDNQDSEQHAVLFVHSEGAVWLLDNKLETAMPAMAFKARYRVIYALNREGASFSPAALGTARGTGPRLAAGGKMLVFRTRPVRRDAAPVVQLAALPPKPAPVAVASLRGVGYWFANRPSPVALALARSPFAVPMRIPMSAATPAMVAP